jgi:23S rRNA (cytidine1920-2'-O)/16S rRNA (cytidine1409-2'-O)-methyltransferase
LQKNAILSYRTVCSGKVPIPEQFSDSRKPAREKRVALPPVQFGHNRNLATWQSPVREVFNSFVQNAVEIRPAIPKCPNFERFFGFALHGVHECVSVAALRYSGRVKVRIDKLLVDRGFTSSRERAQALILAGKVLVNKQKVTKTGTLVPEDAAIRLLGEDLRYVSRGGLKLEAALHHWLIDVRHRVCLDVGASTGGFTDCLLQHGAARVIAVDTGYGQLDFRLRQDPRVRLLEKTNARYLRPEDIGEPVEVVVVDVSFISATLVLPAVLGAAFAQSTANQGGAREVIVLAKPQFEAGREHVEKGGIVRDPAAHLAAINKVRQCLQDLGASSTDVIESPILGAAGNQEFLVRARFP